MTSTETVPRTRRDERRQDQLIAAQIRRDDDAARAKLAAIDRKAATERREARRKVRSARHAAALESLRGNVAELLLVPVILTGAALSWIGMSGYGVTGYGSVGIILPVLSEGGMWAFAEATTLTTRRHPGRPVWHLRSGTVVFAGVGAALNFLHGLPHGIGLGVAMAIISVSGVTAHQLITAGPRWSGAERDKVRIERRIARKIRKARKDAIDDAEVDLHAPDGPQLVMAGEPSREGAAGQAPETIIPAGATVPEIPTPEPVTVAVRKSAFGTLTLTFVGTDKKPASEPTPGPTPGVPKAQVSGGSVGTGKADSKPSVVGAPQPPKAPTRSTVGGRRPRASRGDTKLDTLIAEGGRTNAEIAKLARVTKRTVERRKAKLKEAADHTVTSLADRRAASQGR